MTAGAWRGIAMALPLAALLWAGIGAAAYHITPPNLRHEARLELHAAKLSVRESLRG